MNFKNTTSLSKSDVKEINLQIYLKTPLYVVLYVVCILSIVVRLVDYFVNNIVNLSALIPFVLALLAMLFVYFSNNRNMYNQTVDDKGEPIEYSYTVGEGVLNIETSDGKKHKLELKMIYKSFESKNCFAIRGRDNSFFIIKKSGFLEGTAEDFAKLLKEYK